MTKKKIHASSIMASTKSKPSYREKILGSLRFKAIKERLLKNKTLIAVFAVVGLCAHFFPVEMVAAPCMLYMLAENGKKSGRAGGNVYMRNGRIRGFTVPSLVQNEATSTQRNSFSSLSAQWNAISNDERLTWLEATGFFKSNRFGVAVPLVGKELFVSLNRALYNIGSDVITEAPLPAEIPAMDSLVVAASTAAGGSLTLTFTPAIEENQVFKVFATAQLSAGTNRPGKSAFRLLTTLDEADTSPANIHAAYVARFGTLVAGRKVFIKLVGTNAVTGQQGSGIIASDIVA